MGLAGVKTRRKLAFDPNNTKWSRDETTFGQKILRSHGWEPGQFLGAQDSSHSDLHSAASAAPIRVTLKDDTLGLGAKVRQKQADECTGLDVFKDLLGRLNGKSDDTIKKEQTLRAEIKTSTYVERKFGLMRFVKGGLLVGDQMTDLLKKEEPVKEDEVKEESKDQILLADVPTQEDDGTSKSKKEKKSKKRKAEESESPEEPEVKKEKKKKKRSKEEATEAITASTSTSEDERRAKKEKKKAKKLKAAEALEEDDEVKSKSKKSKKRKTEVGDEAGIESEDASDSKKKQKKEKKRKQRDASAASSEEASATVVAVISTPAESGTATPVASGTSTPQSLSTRHFVRSRNIASKRKALDAAALAQIFMVKPV
ncbi:G-patch domain-containing protein [Apiospora kogelbergensis]|uniref:PinX1-related protein 1 n=1 Tax=Apiospora kogelbergensis TaxID=1337665 RepID=A0AAW0QGB3_9PEZI